MEQIMTWARAGQRRSGIRKLRAARDPAGRGRAGTASDSEPIHAKILQYKGGTYPNAQGRTGTKSLQLALEQLGFGRCYHAVNLVNEHLLDGHLALWEEAAAAPDAFDWARLFQDLGYASAVDFPASLYAVSMAARYPAAKVVLTVRDSAQVWYESARRVSLAFHPSVSAPLGTRLFFGVNPVGRRIFSSLNASFLSHFDDVSNATRTEEQYEEWIAHVRREVPAERLLVFNVKQGWAPLCEFLAVPLPEDGRPFPRAHEGLLVQFRDTMLVNVAGYATVLLPLGLLTTAALRCASKRVPSNPSFATKKND